ncbi:MAG: AAA family ATPase [Lachnospiraceae bacterium]|nr:AAA family ATPase [Lachnospiraceae bacterium]
MREFRGREVELNSLKKKFDTDEFQMVVLYGRRRIGKTELMNEFMHRQKCKCVSFTASEQSENELLSIMTETVLTELAPDMIGMVEFPSFEKLFEFIGNKAIDERIIFFIDEYPYLAKQCTYIQSVLQKVIDNNWKKTKMFFCLCGSLIAFMKDEILSEAAPLHGRATLELKLQAFNYRDTAEFVQKYTCEEKAIVYGLTNGVAKYIEQFNDNKSLEQNIIDEYFAFGGYFTEEQVKTIVTSERQNPALYNSIVSAIATGHTRNSEIASCVGMDDISYPLKMLQKAEIIEKRIANKPYYLLNDSMLVFWYKYVNRAVSLINVGKGEKYYYNSVSDKIHDFMGNVFEKMCKEFLFMKAGENDYPIITEIDNFQKIIVDENGKQRQIEIDIIGRDGKDILIVGECKFTNEKVNKEIFDSFMEKTHYIKGQNPLLCMFSLKGYTDYVVENAEGVILLTIEVLYL